MSVLLKRQLDARIERLETQLASQDPDSVKAEIRQLNEAKNIASSKRMRNSLQTEIGFGECDLGIDIIFPIMFPIS